MVPPPPQPREQEDVSGHDWDLDLLLPPPLPAGLLVCSRGRARLLPPVQPEGPLPDLFAFSSKYGLLFVAESESVRVVRYPDVQEVLEGYEELVADRAAPSELREAIVAVEESYARFKLEAPAVRLVLSPDNSLLFAGSKDAVFVFELAGLKQGESRPHCWEAKHLGCNLLAVSVRNHFACTAGSAVAEYQVSMAHPLRNFKTELPITSVAYSPDGDCIAVGMEGRIECFKAGKREWAFDADEGGAVMLLKWARVDVLLACLEDGSVVVHDLLSTIDYKIYEALDIPPSVPSWDLRFYAAYVAPWSAFVFSCSHSQAIGIVGEWSDGDEKGWSRWLMRKSAGQQESTLTLEVLDFSVYGLGQRPVLSDDSRVFPLSLELCMCSTSKVSPYFVLGGDKEIEGKPAYPPPPTLLMVTTDGMLEAVGLVSADVDSHQLPSLCTPSVGLPAHAVLTIKTAPEKSDFKAKDMVIVPAPMVQWTVPVANPVAPSLSLGSFSSALPVITTPTATPAVATKGLFSFAATPAAPATAPFSAPFSAAAPLATPSGPLLTPMASNAASSTPGQQLTYEALQARLAALELENSRLKEQHKSKPVPDLVSTIINIPAPSFVVADIVPKFTPSAPPAKDSPEIVQAVYLLLEDFDRAIEGLSVDDVAHESLLASCEDVARNCRVFENHMTVDVKDEIIDLSADLEHFQRDYFLTEWQIEEADALLHRMADNAVTPGDAARLKHLAMRLDKLVENVSNLQESFRFRRMMIMEPKSLTKHDSLKRATAVHKGIRDRFKTLKQLEAIVAALEAKQQAAAVAQSAASAIADEEAAGAWELNSHASQRTSNVSSEHLARCLASTKPDVSIAPLATVRATPRKTVGERVEATFGVFVASGQKDQAMFDSARKESVERLSALKHQSQRNIEAMRTPARTLVFADRTVATPATTATPLNLLSRPQFTMPPPSAQKPSSSSSSSARMSLAESAPANVSDFQAGAKAAAFSSLTAESLSEAKPAAAQPKSTPFGAAPPPSNNPPPSFSQTLAPLGFPSSAPSAAAPEDPKLLVRDFYRAHVPNKPEAEVEGILAKYAGKEADLFSNLQKKYPNVFDAFRASRSGGAPGGNPGFGSPPPQQPTMQTGTGFGSTSASIAPFGTGGGFGSTGFGGLASANKPAAAFGGGAFAPVANTGGIGFGSTMMGSLPGSNPVGASPSSAFQNVGASSGTPGFGQTAFGSSSFGFTPANTGTPSAFAQAAATSSLPSGTGFGAFASPSATPFGGGGGVGAQGGGFGQSAFGSLGAQGSQGAFGGAASGFAPSAVPNNAAFTKMRG